MPYDGVAKTRVRIAKTYLSNMLGAFSFFNHDCLTTGMFRCEITWPEKNEKQKKSGKQTATMRAENRQHADKYAVSKCNEVTDSSWRNMFR